MNLESNHSDDTSLPHHHDQKVKYWNQNQKCRKRCGCNHCCQKDDHHVLKDITIVDSDPGSFMSTWNSSYIEKLMDTTQGKYWKCHHYHENYFGWNTTKDIYPLCWLAKENAHAHKWIKTLWTSNIMWQQIPMNGNRSMVMSKW